MAKVYTFLAEGCEEVEALITVDLLRRAGNQVDMISINGKDIVTGANGIAIVADRKIEDGGLDDADVYFLPGGMPGTKYLGECQTLTELLKKKFAEGKRIAAICAAPSVLGALGILQGKKAVCYPGIEDKLTGAEVLQVTTVSDGNVTTGRGVGAALDFALEIIRQINSPETAAEVKEQVVYPY